MQLNLRPLQLDPRARGGPKAPGSPQALEKPCSSRERGPGREGCGVKSLAGGASLEANQSPVPWGGTTPLGDPPARAGPCGPGQRWTGKGGFGGVTASGPSVGVRKR